MAVAATAPPTQTATVRPSPTRGQESALPALAMAGGGGSVDQSVTVQSGAIQIHAVRVDVSRDAGGRMQLDELPDSDFELDVDLVLLAMGYVGPRADVLAEQLGTRLTPRGTVAVDARFASSVDGVFACGDASRGQSLIVWAISDGRECARELDAWLLRRESILPTRGLDQPFA